MSIGLFILLLVCIYSRQPKSASHWPSVILPLLPYIILLLVCCTKRFNMVNWNVVVKLNFLWLE